MLTCGREEWSLLWDYNGCSRAQNEGHYEYFESQVECIDAVHYQRLTWRCAVYYCLWPWSLHTKWYALSSVRCMHFLSLAAVRTFLAETSLCQKFFYQNLLCATIQSGPKKQHIFQHTISLKQRYIETDFHQNVLRVSENKDTDVFLCSC